MGNFKELLENLLIEIFDVKAIPYGIDLKDEKWIKLPPSDMISTFFQSSATGKIYGVYIDFSIDFSQQSNSVGFAVLDDYKMPEEFDTFDNYLMWLANSAKMNAQKDVPSPISVFSSVFYILITKINELGLDTFSFSAAHENKPQLEKLYNKLVVSDSFIQKANEHGFIYDGKFMDHYKFKRKE